MRVDDTGGTRTPAPAVTPKPKPKPAAPPEPKAQKSSPAPAPTSSGAAPSSAAKALDRDPETTSSNPAAARPVTDRQASSAAGLTAKRTSGLSTFERIDAQESGTADPVKAAAEDDPKDERDDLVENPIEQEERADVKTPKPFKVGTDLPEIPTFKGQTPKSKETSPTGQTVETFEQDGVTYTRTSFEGKVTTTFKQDGVDYSQVSEPDGTSSLELEKRNAEGGHSRTIEYDAKGKLVTDSSHSSKIHGDRDYEVRQETVDAKGVRTIEETVSRPDGGLAQLTRTEKPSGTVYEIYEYEGDQGTVNRTTDTRPDGSAETRTERNYTVDSPLEEVLSGKGVKEPSVPGASKDRVPELPEGEREDTVIREVEVVSTSPSGAEQVEYAEETYSQTSNDVEFEVDEFYGLEALKDGDASATRTVTRVKARDEDGNLVESTGASQSVTVKGNRSEELGGGEPSFTSTETWNDKGESSSTVATEGFTGVEHGLDLALSPDALYRFQVGGKELNVLLPGEGRAHPRDAYLRKAPDWLSGASGIEEGRELDPLDFSVTVNRDSEGKIVSESTTVSELDESGDGRTVTKTDAGGSVSWAYAEYSNDGQDYKKQTVIEGTEISIYETHEVTGPGQFRSTSETSDGGKVIADSETSRQELTESELRQYIEDHAGQDGQPTEAQLERMLRDGPPYYLSQHQEHSTAWKDEDGKLREDEDGNPLQLGHETSSFSLENSHGYAVSSTYRELFDEEGGSVDSRLSTVTDPDADPPLSGTLNRGERSPSGNYYKITESGPIEIDSKGRLSYQGKEVGQYDFGDADLASLLADGSVDASDLLEVVKTAADGGQYAGMVRGSSGGRFNLTGDTGALARVSEGTDILGVFAGTHGLISGIADGDGREIVEGLGDISGGLNSLAAATAGLGGTSKLGTTAQRLSTLTEASTALGKVLGGVGGAISLGFGLYDVFTADSTRGKVAGGLGAASGAVALGSLWFGPPGWLLGGLISGGLGIASFLVGREDPHRTEPLDDRLT